jgi:hypothetical protein
MDEFEKLITEARKQAKRALSPVTIYLESNATAHSINFSPSGSSETTKRSGGHV